MRKLESLENGDDLPDLRPRYACEDAYRLRIGRLVPCFRLRLPYHSISSSTGLGINLGAGSERIEVENDAIGINNLIDEY